MLPTVNKDYAQYQSLNRGRCNPIYNRRGYYSDDNFRRLTLKEYKMKRLIFLIAVLFSITAVAQIKPSQMSAATVAAMKTKLGVMTQTEADLRYPLISDGDPTPIYTQAEANAIFSRRVLSSNVQTLHTGTTAETTIYTGTIPENSIGVNGSFNCVILLKFTNNANTKTVRIKFNDTTVWWYQGSSTMTLAKSYDLNNRNSLTTQVSGNNATSNYGSFGGSSADVSTYTFNTSADIIITITVELATGTDSCGFEFFRIIANP
jgi:hypothetical protein